MFSTRYPTEILSAETIQLIRDQSAQAEAKGHLTQEQLQLIYRHNWFRMFVPRHLGGLEMPLPEALALLESAAYADGSFGWTLNLGAGAGLFAAYLAPALSRSVFQDNSACIAGSGAVAGTAEDYGAYYIIKGQWKYASGSSHATAFTVNCTIQLPEGQKNAARQEHAPPVLSFLFFPDEIILKETWDSHGLKATASHDFEVQRLKVSKERSFNLFAASPYEKGALYQFPFMPFAEITTASQVTGMALHFIDEFQRTVSDKKGMQGESLKNNAKVKDSLALAEAKLESSRAWLYALTEEAWQCCEKGVQLPENLMRKISLAGRYAAQSARESVELLYPLTGMSALSPQRQLNKVWRDLHTATQHILISPIGFAEKSRPY